MSLLKKNWRRKGLLVLAVIFCISGIWCFTGKQTTYSGRSNPERIAYLERNGWEVQEEPIEASKVRIPFEFGEVYKNYNQIQLEQGFDLRQYAGKEVERYQYIVTNYPNYTEEVHANLLVFDGKIIGGDICSIVLGGFMHGISQKSREK